VTFLPLIQRELSVRARRRGSYWLRFGVALAAALFALPQLVFSDWSGGTSTVGKTVFNGLVVIAFLLCSGALFLTVDVISSERREGTLGLLFLTRINWFDVVLGKLSSNGLAGLLALVALLPLLMIPVLAGGVTGGEAFRKGVALLDTLFLSLCLGLYASAAAEERFRALRRAGIWVFLIWFVFPVPFVLAFGLGYQILCAFSPLMLTIMAGDPKFVGSGFFWIGAAIPPLLGLVFLWRAGASLRRSVREEEPSPLAGDTTVRPESPQPFAGNRWSARRLRSSPEQWVTSRQRGLRTILWVGAIVGFQYLFSYAFVAMGWGGFSRGGVVRSVAVWLPRILLSAASGAFFAWAASRFFIEGRKTGELELLLTTPVGAQSIVWGQWRSLRKALRAPIGAMLVFMFLPFAFSMMSYRSFFAGNSDMFIVASTISFVISGLNVLFGVHALCLAGLWFGVRASGQFQAILWTIAIAKGLPYLISLLGPLLLGIVGGVYNIGSGYHLLSFFPSLLILAFYLWLIRTAKRKLLKPCAVTEPTLPSLSRALRRLLLDLPEGIARVREWKAS
jgi:hypothetical protein